MEWMCVRRYSRCAAGGLLPSHLLNREALENVLAEIRGRPSIVWPTIARHVLSHARATCIEGVHGTFRDVSGDQLHILERLLVGSEGQHIGQFRALPRGQRLQADERYEHIG